MPLLAGLIKGLFVALLGVLGNWVTKRVAISLAVAAVFITLTAALIVAMNAAISGVIVPMPSWLQRSVCWWMPTNFDDCVSAMLAGQVTRWAYDIHVKQIQMKWAF